MLNFYAGRDYSAVGLIGDAMNFGVENTMRRDRIAANIIICARKMKRLTQSDVTKSVGLAQSTLSRIEAGILVPSIFLWMDLTDLLDIPVGVLRYGVLDNMSKAEIRSGIFENGFKIPRTYAKEKCIKVREISPLIRYITIKHGEKKTKRIFKELGVDKDFFVSYDNQFNLRFADDLLLYLHNAFGFQASDIKDVVELGMCDQFVHGRLGADYAASEGTVELLQKFFKNVSLYHSLYRQEMVLVGDKEMIVTYTPNPVVYDQVKALSDFSREFLHVYKRELIENLPKMTFGKNASLFEKIKVTRENCSEETTISYRIKVFR